MMNPRRETAIEPYGLQGTTGSTQDQYKSENGHAHDPAGEEGRNDHLASIYEGQQDQFNSIVPFIRKGLERGERSLYIADDNTEEEVRSAFRRGGIDVDAAIEAGALTIHTKHDTYLRTGRFDQEAMLDFWRELLTEAQGQQGYTGVRAAAEMSWVLDEETGLDRLVEYESMLNTLYPGEDYVVLCQYNRARFPDEVLSDVIQSHPLVVYDGTVGKNVQYRQPEEFFTSDRPLLDVDRTVEELVRRARTQRALQERDQYQRELYRITSAPHRSFEEKLDALFELGRDYFNLQSGGLARIDPVTNQFEVESVSGENDFMTPGERYPLSETFCRLLAGEEGATGISDPAAQGFKDALCHDVLGIQTYLGTRLEIDGGLDRSFFFVSTEPREESFSENERTFHHLMGQWVESELQRQQREAHLAGLNTLSRRLMQAASKQAVCDIVAEASETTLSLPIAAVALLDDGSDTLRLAAATDRATKIFDANSILTPPDGVAWRAFTENEPCQEDFPIQGGAPSVAPTCRLHALPLGRHGVFISGTLGVDLGPSSTCDVVETVAANMEAALDRAHREQQLQEREKALTDLTNTLEERVEERTRQVRKMTSRVTMAEQRERRRIARILHDDLQQRLYGIQLKMTALRNGSGADATESLLEEIEELEEQVEEVIYTTRRLSVGMSPPVLRSEGLTAALEWLQSHMKKTQGLDVGLSADGEFPMGEEMRVLLFQITRELLVTLPEHTGGEQAEVELREVDGGVSIRVIDRGNGDVPHLVDGEETQEGLGLTATRERVHLFDGELQVQAVPGRGTEVTLWMPVDSSSRASVVRKRPGTAT